jgi:hypothetical protein
MYHFRFVGQIAKMGSQKHINIPTECFKYIDHLEQEKDYFIEITIRKFRNSNKKEQTRTTDLIY